MGGNMKKKMLAILVLINSLAFADTTTININVTVVIKLKFPSEKHYGQVWRPHTPMMKPLIDYSVFNKLSKDEMVKILKLYSELMDEYREDEYSYLHREDGTIIESKIHHKLYSQNKNWVPVIIEGKKVAVPAEFSIRFKNS
jgi:hypothetical protein